MITNIICPFTPSHSISFHVTPQKSKKMNKTKIFTITLLLATLAVGCSKDETTSGQNNGQGKAPLRLYVNNIANNGSKVSFDPSGDNNFTAQWVEDELVNLNGSLYTVGLYNDEYYALKDNDNNFIVANDVNGNDMVAIYPGANFGNNNVEVNDSEIILHSLEINFKNDGTQSTVFPLYASEPANSLYLYFNHLTCGIQLRLKNSTGDPINIASLTIVAQSTTDVENLGKDGFSARWAVEQPGPWVPMGPVGENNDENGVDIKYSSVMNFDFNDVENHQYKTITNGQTLEFCVPVTISSLKYLKVAGYDENGNLIFYKKKSFENAQTLVRNYMYPFPVIEITNNNQ